MHQERREYTRIEVELPSVLCWPDGTVSSGVVRDLSFGGAYLVRATGPAPAEDGLPVRGCQIEMEFALSGAKPVVARIGCDLVDLEARRLGLRFTGAEESEYERLRQGLIALAPDPDALVRELEEMPNPAFAVPLLPSFRTWLTRMLARLRD